MSCSSTCICGEDDTRELLDRLRAAGIPVALVTGSVDLEEYRDAADAVARASRSSRRPRRDRTPPR